MSIVTITLEEPAVTTLMVEYYYPEDGCIIFLLHVGEDLKNYKSS
jgi:hypothetical protein